MASRALVIDNWGPEALVRAVDATWPGSDWPYWHKYADAHAIKYGSTPGPALPAAAREVLSRMAALDIDQCGIRWGGFPDLDLHGAGLHSIPPGGHLQMHLDGAVHPMRRWGREASALLFVGDWKPGWGGELCFCDDPHGAPVEIIKPQFNRLVLFRTSDSAYHGVSPVIGPCERRTVSLFWWSRQATESMRERAEFVT